MKICLIVGALYTGDVCGVMVELDGVDMELLRLMGIYAACQAKRLEYKSECGILNR